MVETLPPLSTGAYKNQQNIVYKKFLAVALKLTNITKNKGNHILKILTIFYHLTVNTKF